MTVSEGDIIKLVLDYTYPGAGTALSIFNYVYGGIDRDDAEFMDDILDDFGTPFAALWALVGGDNATLDNVAGFVVDTAGNVLLDLGERVIDEQGTVGGTAMPAAVSGYLQAYTAVPRVLGKKYLPAIGENAVVNGEFDAPALATLISVLGFYYSPQVLTGGGTIFPGVLSSKVGDFQQFLESGLVQSLPAYQRRRKQGVGS